MPKITLKQIKEEVVKMDKNIEVEGEHFKTAVILLSSLVVGPSIKKLISFTGYKSDEIQPRAANLRKNGVWRGSKLAVDWFDKEDGGIAFWCDCLVADGLVERKG